MSTLRSKMKMFVSPIVALAMVVSGFAAFAAAPANAAGRTLTIHYHRTAGDYTGWNLWTWGDLVTKDMITFTGDDAFGKVAVLDVTDAGTSVGFLFRSTDNWDTAVKDLAPGAGGGGGDRGVTLAAGNNEIWLIQGDKNAYTFSPRVLRIHYKRTNADYTGWNLWTWGDTNKTGFADDSRQFDGEDEYGVVANVPVTADGTGIGFLFRSTDNWDTAVKDLAPGAGGGGGDRAATFGAGILNEIWMLEGDATAYTSNPAIIVPTDQTIRAFVKKTVKAGKWVTFPMLTTDGTKVKWKSLTPGKCKVIGRNRIVGVSAGLCKLNASAPGSKSLNPMPKFAYSITVKK